MRFHVLGIPHTVSTPDYSSCAFTQKVVKLCKMLKARGHYVIHYGHEDSKVDCSEHVTVVTAKDFRKAYGKWDWHKQGFPRYNLTDHVYLTFNAEVIKAIAARKQPKDFLLCSFGLGHKAVADANGDMIVCESGIGYPEGSFAKFRVFESYAILHAYHGQAAIKNAAGNQWYDAVIPNFFDILEFDFSDEKEDFLLFLGRVNSGKGIHVARQLAEATKTKLIVAGMGDGTLQVDTKYIKHIGVVGPKKRAHLLSRAKAILCPSTFLEPFCGTQIEAMLSGTPVISSDWGAFAEYNLHGKTGYRCKTFEQFTWALANIHKLKSMDCRTWAKRFSLENIGPMYDDYFASALECFGLNAKGWYAENSGRQNLDSSSWKA